MTAPRNEWTIGPDGVGSLKLGEKVPPALLGKDLDGRYVARMIADGQPMEGYRLDAPPVTFAMEDGPFVRAAEKDGEAHRSPDLFRTAAGKAVRAGAKVKMIFVHEDGPKTAAGVGVGSDLPAVRAAYPDLKVRGVPPTMGKDECVATSPSLKNVHFLFRSRKAAEQGEKVLRIDLFRDR